MNARHEPPIGHLVCATHLRRTIASGILEEIYDCAAGRYASIRESDGTLAVVPVSSITQWTPPSATD